MIRIGTHRTHCCIMHGCKYSNKNCPVELEQVMQAYLCEYCDDAQYEADEWGSGGLFDELEEIAQLQKKLQQRRETEEQLGKLLSLYLQYENGKLINTSDDIIWFMETSDWECVPIVSDDPDTKTNLENYLAGTVLTPFDGDAENIIYVLLNRGWRPKKETS